MGLDMKYQAPVADCGFHPDTGGGMRDQGEGQGDRVQRFMSAVDWHMEFSVTPAGLGIGALDHENRPGAT